MASSLLPIEIPEDHGWIRNDDLTWEPRKALIRKTWSPGTPDLLVESSPPDYYDVGYIAPSYMGKKLPKKKKTVSPSTHAWTSMFDPAPKTAASLSGVPQVQQNLQALQNQIDSGAADLDFLTQEDNS
jgi:hypothetical protein